MKTSNLRAGFTVVEVLILLVIVAVLAATFLPGFVSFKTGEKASELRLDLHDMRQAIELYKLEHDGAAPAVVNGTIPGLIFATDGSGNTKGSAVPDDTFSFGPYLKGGRLPANPFDGTGGVTASDSFPPTAIIGGGKGWIYDPASGEIAANSDSRLAD